MGAAVSTFLIVVVPSLIAAGGGLLMRSQLRAPLRQAHPDRTDYQALFAADQLRSSR